MTSQNHPLPIWMLIFNALWFQAGWFICVLLGNTAALIYALVSIVVYLFLIPVRLQEWKLFLSVVLLGLCVDTFLASINVLVFPSGNNFPPVWLITLWFLFATTLNSSLKKITSRLLIITCLGCLGGTLSYYAGVRLTSVELGLDLLPSILALAITWATVSAGLHFLHRYWINENAIL